MATTWNPADNTATLSNGNNTSAGSGGVGSRATNSISGKNRVEFVAGSSDDVGGYAFGIADAATSLATGAGGSAYIIQAVAGTVYLVDSNVGAAAASYSGTITAGDIFDVDIDLPSLKLYLSQNNVKKVGDVDAGTGGVSIASGTYFPYVLFGSAGSLTLDADTPTYSPPSGYTIIGGGGGPSNDLIVTETGPDTAAASGAVNNGPFPTIAARSSARTTASDTTSHAITLPSGIAAGDRLLVVFSVDGNPTVSVNTGVSGSNWQKLGQDSNTTVVTGAIFWKIAEGGDALTLTTSVAEQSSHMALRLTNAAAITGSSANGSSTNSNPPSHTPSGGSNDYLWLATRSGDSTTVATVAPANFSNLQTLAGVGTSSASTNTAERLFTGSVLDPGTFTSATEQWVSWTIAVAPAAPPVSGDLATTEGGSDTIVADGTVGSAGVSGNLSASEAGADTAAGTGSVLVAGALSTTESGSDTASASGAVLVAGALSASETGEDVFAASGAAFASGDLSAQEASSDTATIAGVVALTGELVATESGADSVEASGQIYVRGTLASSEQGADGITGTGALLVQGAVLVGETGGDALSSNGVVAITGSLAASEAGADTFFGSGGSIASGYLDAAESGADGLASVGNVPATGALSAPESGSDTSDLSGAIRVTGAVDASEASADVTAITGAVLVSGSVLSSEIGADSAALAGRILIAGGLVAVESGGDTLDASGGLVIAGEFGAVEVGEDSLVATGFITEGFPSAAPPTVMLSGRTVLRQTLGAVARQTSLISARASGVITLKGRFSASG
jgi:hypothetical protein